MTRALRLFIVDNDVTHRERLLSFFKNHGLDVTSMHSAIEMFQRLEAGARPDLVILDVSLPGLSGLEACRRLRESGDHVAIILLTALTDEMDRILGLEMGADDYVAKPFSPRELLARARAVLRRGRFERPPAAGQPDPAATRIGDWIFHPSVRTLHRGQQVRVLNAVEHAMLTELTSAPGRPLTRAQLLLAAHATRDPSALRAVDTSIMRLRRIVEVDPSSPRYIQTVRLQGYMFVPQHLELLV